MKKTGNGKQDLILAPFYFMSACMVVANFSAVTVQLVDWAACSAGGWGGEGARNRPALDCPDLINSWLLSFIATLWRQPCRHKMSLFAAFRGLHWPIVNCPQLQRFWRQPCHPEMSTIAAFRGATLANSKLSTIAAFWRQDWRKVGQILQHIGGKIGQPAVGATLPPKGGKWGQWPAVERGRMRKVAAFHCG